MRLLMLFDNLTTPEGTRRAMGAMSYATRKLLTMGEFCREIGSNSSTVRMWIDKGTIRALSGPARGSHKLFDETSLVQGKAAVAVARILGDGTAAKLAMAKVPTLKAGDTELVVEGPDKMELVIHV